MTIRTFEPGAALRFRIKPAPPFDFDLSCRIFRGGGGMVQDYSEGTFHRVLRLDKQLWLIAVRSTGTVDAPALVVDAEPVGRSQAGGKGQGKADGNRQSEASTRKLLKAAVAAIFNLDLDLKLFYRDVRKDPVLAPVTRRLKGLRSPAATEPYEALISAIIEQQISLKAAWSMQKKLIAAYGEPVSTDTTTYYSFPTPERLAAAAIADLKACGISGRKSEYIIDTSALIAAGQLDLRGLMALPAEEIIEQLTKIRGIGRWTAEMTMIRGMHKPEALPADDLGLRKLVSHYYNDGKMMSGAEVRLVAERWGRWKGLAAFYLIVADMTEVA